MWNGNFGKLQALFLAFSIAASGGCGPGAVPSRPHEAGAARDRTWTVTRDGVLLQDRANPGTTLVPLPDWLWAGAPYGCGPDLALGPKGEIVVTSDVLPTLWRIDPQTRAVSVHPLALDADADKDVGFSSISYSARHGTYFAVSHDHGSLWRIDPLLRRAQKTPLAAQLPNGCPCC